MIDIDEEEENILIKILFNILLFTLPSVIVASSLIITWIILKYF